MACWFVTGRVAGEEDIIGGVGQCVCGGECVNFVPILVETEVAAKPC